jgi:hypothetical protein
MRQRRNTSGKTLPDTDAEMGGPGRIQECSEKVKETALHIYTNYRIFMQARSSQWGRAFDLPPSRLG